MTITRILLAVAILAASFAWWLFTIAIRTNRQLIAINEDLEQANAMLKKENAQFYKFGVAQRMKAEDEKDWPEVLQ